MNTLTAKLQRRKNGKKGFTLVELIVVIVIILILAAVMVPLLMNYIGQAKEAKRLNDLKTFQTVVSAKTAEFMVDPGGTPSSWKKLANNTTGKVDHSAYVYQVGSSCQFDSNYATIIIFGDPTDKRKEYEIEKIGFIFFDDNFASSDGTYIYTPETGWKRDDNEFNSIMTLLYGIGSQYDNRSLTLYSSWI